MNQKNPRPPQIRLQAESRDQRYVIMFRHGLAETRSNPADDPRRRLTTMGHSEVAVTARGLQSLVPRISLIVTSSFPRARDTAKRLADRFHPRHGVLELSSLRPGGHLRATSAFLRRIRLPVIAVVGHEPDLSNLAAQLCGMDPATQLHLSKSGARLLVLESPGPGGARMIWQLRAQQLKELAEDSQTRA